MKKFFSIIFTTVLFSSVQAQTLEVYNGKSEKMKTYNAEDVEFVEPAVWKISDENTDTILAKERQALIDFYNATGGDNWTNNTNWCSDKPLNEWYGIIVINNHVNSIYLGNNNLSGEILSSLSDLTQLENLFLASNQLTGSIPESIGNLSQLKTLWLNSNQLTGSIPETIGNLSQLEGLYMSTNQLTGSIPESIGNLLQLETLFLGVNQLTGGIPETIGNLSKLKTMDLSTGQLTGNIPESFGNLSQLESLYLVSNQLTGCIPETIGNLSHLKNLWLSSNQLTGNIPESFINLTNLESLRLNDNYLSGYIPKVILESYLWDSFVKELTAQQKGEGLMVDSSLLYKSSDYSKDGEVYMLQKATEGKGIDFIFMGDSYVDLDMEDGGVYEQDMKTIVDNLFEFEPYKTFRNRFNIYIIRVVSANREILAGASQALNENIEEVYKYANKITTIDKDSPLYINVLINPKFSHTEKNSGYAYMFNDGSFISWSKNYGVISHEAGGHGFAKLGDEFSGSETFTYYNGLDENHKRGWSVNVDYHSKPDEVIWKHFLADERYKNEVGIYEGAEYYGYGIYRPSEISMMSFVGYPYNAPSREAIYKAIMKASEGEGWTYDYEEFVKYDEINRNAATRANYVEKLPEVDVENWKRHHKSPVFINKTWREVVEGK